jgi:hypothetical protein
MKMSRVDDELERADVVLNTEQGYLQIATIWKFKSHTRALFSVGQAYTALSRGMSLEGLSIMHLDRAVFIVDKEAVKEQGLLEA